jgi:hypothetical protein
MKYSIKWSEYMCVPELCDCLPGELESHGFTVKTKTDSHQRVDFIAVRRLMNQVLLIRYGSGEVTSQYGHAIMMIPLDVMRFIWVRFSKLKLASDIEEIMFAIPGREIRSTSTGCVRDWLRG